jgi:hypothetical protein
MTLYWKSRENDPWHVLNPKWQKKNKPHGISGYVRVKNEAQFLYESVASHMPWLDEVRICYMESTDRTEEVIDQLRRDFGYSKVMAHSYRHDVAQPLTEEFKHMPDDSVNSFVYSSNWGLSYCNYSWVSKFEGDVICLSSFDKIRKAVDKEPNAIRYYGRTGLNIAGDGDMFSVTHPTNAGWDEGVFNNDPELFHFIKLAGKWEGVNFDNQPHTKYQMGASFLHTKRMKSQYANQIVNGTKEKWYKVTKANLRKVLQDRYDDIYWEERYGTVQY